MFNADNQKKKDAKAVRIAEPDSSTEPCEVLISKLTKTDGKLTFVIDPNSSTGRFVYGNEINVMTPHTKESDESDDKESDSSSAISTLELSDSSLSSGEDLELNEALNEEIPVKDAVCQTEGPSCESAAILQDDVIVLSDTEYP